VLVRAEDKLEALLRPEHQAHFIVSQRVGISLEGTLRDNYIKVPDCLPLGTPISSTDGGKYFKLWAWYPNLSLLVFAGVVAAAMAELSLPICAAVGVFALVALGLITVRQAISFVDWNVYVTGAFAFGIGSAMTESGLANVVGKLLVDAKVTGFAVLLLLAVLTSLMANVVSNRGAIQVMYPIVVALFTANGWDIVPGAVIIANAAMGGFLTPYGLSPSLIIAGPGQYRAVHFLKFGTPLLILYSVLSAAATSLVYGFW
jgi:di/tricarboxylate transporter